MISLEFSHHESWIIYSDSSLAVTCNPAFIDLGSGRKH